MMLLAVFCPYEIKSISSLPFSNNLHKVDTMCVLNAGRITGSQHQQ